MSHIFISYDESDEDLAERLATALEESGYSTWYYGRDSIPGPAYLGQVRREIENCTAFLLIISRASIDSHQVINEVVAAYEKRKPLLPALRNLTHAEFQAFPHDNVKTLCQCLGAATAVRLHEEPQRFTEAARRIVAGLRALGVKAEKGAREARARPEEVKKISATEASSPAQRTGPAGVRRDEKAPLTENLENMGGGFYELEGRKYPREVKTDNVGIEMVLIEPGEFMMGSSETEEGRDGDEGPRRRARIPRPFYLGKFAATQAQYESVMGTNPSHFKGENNPVEMVSWNDAKEFCRRLGPGFRLPTEAEWEYACRAGTATPFYFGETVSTDQANYDGTYAYGEGREGDYREKTVPVNSFEPNGWGLYNMHGNVWEWCEDWYDGDYYKGRPSPDFDPQGPPGGDSKVLHGGSWDDDPKLLRSAYRLRYLPASKYNTCGFRIARSIDW